MTKRPLIFNQLSLKNKYFGVGECVLGILTVRIYILETGPIASLRNPTVRRATGFLRRGGHSDSSPPPLPLGTFQITNVTLTTSNILHIWKPFQQYKF